MFTETDHPEPMDDREDLEECVIEQIIKDIGTGLLGEVLRSLSKLSQDSLLEFLPVSHPVWQGRRQSIDYDNVFLMPPYTMSSIDNKVFNQFMWIRN